MNAMEGGWGVKVGESPIEGDDDKNGRRGSVIRSFQAQENQGNKLKVKNKAMFLFLQQFLLRTCYIHQQKTICCTRRGL